MAKKNRIPHKFHPWIDVRKRYGLTHAQIQMARELGLNPKRFVGYANREQQPWKLPLAQYIESLYQDRFKKSCPDTVRSIEQIAADHMARRAAKKANKLAVHAAVKSDANPGSTPADPVASADPVAGEGTA